MPKWHSTDIYRRKQPQKDIHQLCPTLVNREEETENMWELRKENSFVTGCEGETVTKDTQPEIKQQIATIDLKTSNVDNIRCFNERLKGL